MKCKKISTFNSTLVQLHGGAFKPIGKFIGMQLWTVITEGGSSGSPIFNQDKELLVNYLEALFVLHSNFNDLYGKFQLDK